MIKEIFIYPFELISTYPGSVLSLFVLRFAIFFHVVFGVLPSLDGRGRGFAVELPFSSTRRMQPQFKHFKHSVGLIILQLVHVHCSTEAIVPIVGGQDHG